MLQKRQDIDDRRAGQRVFDLPRAAVMQIRKCEVARRDDLEAEGLHREVAVRVLPDLRLEILGRGTCVRVMDHFV